MSQAPHSLETISIPAPEEKPSPMVRRFGNYAKGTVLPETTVPHSPRRKVNLFPHGFLKIKWIEHLEQNQLLHSCCRHPENHEIESFKSHPEEPAPDIYIFHCTCGRKHRFFCVGMTDPQRPEWR